MLVKLNDTASVVVAIAHLKYGPIAIEFHAGGKRFEIVLAPLGGIAYSYTVTGMHSNALLITILHYGATCVSDVKGNNVFPLLLDEFGMSLDDAANITALITAIFHPKGAKAFLEGLKLNGDSVVAS